MTTQATAHSPDASTLPAQANLPVVASADQDAEIVLRADQVTKVFPGTVALDHVDFFVRRGKVNALVGENGAGKSTLMKILAGVEQPTSGHLFMNGEQIHLRSPLEAEKRGYRHYLPGNEPVPEPERGREHLLGSRSGAQRRDRPEGAARTGARAHRALGPLPSIPPRW